MRTPYEQTMDQVRLSDEQKRSLAGNLQAAWDVAEKPPCPEAAPHPAPRPMSRRLVCALAVAAALVIGTCGLALAAGLGNGGLTTLVQHLFGSAPGDSEIVEPIGAEQSACATDNGVTIALEAIVGDQRNLYLLLKLTDDLGTNFGLGPDESLAAMSALSLDVSPASPGSPLVVESITSNSLLDPSTPPNTAYIVIGAYLSEGSWPGREVNLSMMELQAVGSWPSDGEPSIVPIDGAWTLTFPVDYGNTTRELPGGQTLQVGKSQLVIGSIYLSPLGVDIVFPVTDEAVESGAVVAPFAGTQDLVWMPVVLTMDDGTTLELGPGAGTYNGSGPNGLYDGEVKRTARSDRPIDPEKVVSIAIGDQLVVEVPRE